MFSGFGSAPWVGNELPENSNPLSMHYKHIMPEDAEKDN